MGDFPVRSGARKEPRRKKDWSEGKSKESARGEPDEGKATLCISSSGDDVESSREINYVAHRGLWPMGGQPSGAM